VRVLGEDPGKETRRRTGVVFQESCLDPLMTLHETLSLHGRLFGMGGARLRSRIDSLLEAFGLAERSKDAVGTLSGGLRRRLELARALLVEPAVLLLDEPSTGLDPDSRRALWEHLREARASGVTLLLATNDVAEAERECDTVAFLHQGRLVAEGKPAELKAGLKRDAVLLECNDGRAAALAREIADWPGVGQITAANATLHVTVDDVSSFVPRLFQAGGDGIRAIRMEPSTLEDAYFDIAGAPLHRSAEDAS
jgi:ABC-2 type transport system ATP-binding protein